MSTYDWALALACLCLIPVLAGLGYDLLRGEVHIRKDVRPRNPGPCVHCSRDYHDHEAKHHYCPTKGGWSEVTFQEGVDE